MPTARAIESRSVIILFNYQHDIEFFLSVTSLTIYCQTVWVDNKSDIVQAACCRIRSDCRSTDILPAYADNSWLPFLYRILTHHHPRSVYFAVNIIEYSNFMGQWPIDVIASTGSPFFD